MADETRREHARAGQDPTMIGNTDVRLRRLREADDFEVADGDPDIRGWRVLDADGKEIGEVHDLVVDVGVMRVRYIDVDLSKDAAGLGRGKHVLVPIGTSRLNDDVDAVTLGALKASQLASYPRYEHGPVTREDERRVRKVILGSTAQASGTDEDFYGHEHFDASRFWGSRPHARATVFYEVARARRRVD